MTPITNGPIGSPDYGQNANSNPTAPVYDLGEVVNRLLLGGGSQHRTGRWYFGSGFENGSMTEFLVSGGTVVASGANGAWQGNYAALMTTGAVATNVAIFNKYFFSQSSPSARWGVEMMLAVNQQNCTFDVQFTDCNPGNGLLQYFSAVRFLYGAATSNFKLQYLDNTGTWVDVPGGNLGENFVQGVSYIYHNIKIVVDFSTHKYVKIVIDGVIYDLSTIPMQATAAAGQIFQVVSMTLTTTTGSPAVAEVDNVFLTADEP